MASRIVQESVFATTELLELILCHLDIRDLFIVQRVCSSWLETITDSVTLQQQMFLRALSSSSPKNDDASLEAATDTTGCWQCDQDRGRTAASSQATEAVLNPLLDLSTGFSPSLAGNTYINTETPEVPNSLTTTPIAFRGKPSWHRMYLSNPPCQEAEIALWWQTCRCGTGLVHSAKVANHDGVRFHDLFRATICMTGTHKTGPESDDARKKTSLEGFWKKYEEQEGQVVRMGETTCMFLRGVNVSV